MDLNGVPPSATLVSPTNLQSAPLNSQVILEFNELIDATPFLSGTQSPVEFTVRRTRPDGSGGNECDPQSQPQTLAGAQALSFDAARGVSIVSFTPAQTLPGNVCIEVSVTNGVTDLSGRTAEPQVFQFLTEVVPLSDFEIIEEFDDEALLDADASAGSWTGGAAEFAQIGGDGGAQRRRGASVALLSRAEGDRERPDDRLRPGGRGAHRTRCPRHHRRRDRRRRRFRRRLSACEVEGRGSW